MASLILCVSCFFLFVGVVRLPPFHGLVDLPFDVEHELGFAFLSIFCVLDSAYHRGSKESLVFFVLVYVIVAMAEILAPVFVFGAEYDFITSSLGPKLFSNMPIFVPVAWYVSSYPAFVVSETLFSRNIYAIIAAAAVLTTSTNVCSDPILSSVGSIAWKHNNVRKPDWVWRVEGADLLLFEGVPVRNFLGWFVVSLLYFSVFGMLSYRHAQSQSPPSVIAIVLSFCIGAFYVVHPIHPWSVRFVAFSFQCVPALAAIWKISIDSKRVKTNS